MRASCPPRFRIAPALLAAAVAAPWIARAASPTPVPPKPTPAFVPLRVRTDALTATGPGTVEKPFSFKTRTEALTATGPGTVEPEFKPVRIKTDAIVAHGGGTGGPR